jgi:hypothetical protein
MVLTPARRAEIEYLTDDGNMVDYNVPPAYMRAITAAVTELLSEIGQLANADAVHSCEIERLNVWYVHTAGDECPVGWPPGYLDKEVSDGPDGDRD